MQPTASPAQVALSLRTSRFGQLLATRFTWPTRSPSVWRLCRLSSRSVSRQAIVDPKICPTSSGRRPFRLRLRGASVQLLPGWKSVRDDSLGEFRTRDDLLDKLGDLDLIVKDRAAAETDGVRPRT